MDINTIRGLATAVALIAFLGVVFWAYSSKRKGDFDEAASLPFAEDSSDAVQEEKSVHDNKKPSPERGVA